MSNFVSRFQSRLFALGFIATFVGGILLLILLWGKLSTLFMDNQPNNNSHLSVCDQPIEWVRIQNRISSIDEENRMIVKISDAFVENQCATSFSMEIFAPAFEVQSSLNQTVSIAPDRYNSMEWILIPKEIGNSKVTVSNEAESYTRGVFAFYLLGLRYVSIEIIGRLFFPIGILLLALDNYNRAYRKRSAT
jgi:hypothetical protein